MTSGTAPPANGHVEPVSEWPPTEYESSIERRLRQTRRQVKNADVWAALITLAAAVLGYLLFAALIDHWIIPTGLEFPGRLLLFVGLVGGAGLYLATCIVPMLIHRINPIYAAHTIEQGRPSLKNSLVNLLYLRRERRHIERDQVARAIYRALEQKAAGDLAQIPAEAAVDRSHVIRLACLLAALLAACSLYLTLSPKSTLVSFGRVIWPWADVKAPTRVTIEDVEPGDAVAYQGDIIAVSAEVHGLKDDEPVVLYYTTADGQSVDQAVPLTLPEGHYRHRGELPPGRFGLQQDVDYYLAAGDCRTRRFKLEVQTAVSILVEQVEYDYPEYTGLPDRVDRRVGDLKGIEGTEVTVRAGANQDIERAWVEPDCDARRALKMAVEESRTASARFTLRMSQDDPARPEHDSYQIRFLDTSGRQNRRPIRHRIEVIPDLAPQVRFVEPPPEEVQLPEDGVLEFRLTAEDPDFALRRVSFRAERSERSLAIGPSLDKPRPEPPHRGAFETTYRFEPARLGLKAGDTVIYWAEAQDNMEPVPNRSETARRWITIVPPEGRQQPQQQPKEQPQRPERERQKPDEQSPKQPDGAQQQQGAEPGGQQQADQPAAQQPPEGEPPQPSEPGDQKQDPDQQEPGEEGGTSEPGGAAGDSRPQAADRDSGQEDSDAQGAEGQQAADDAGTSQSGASADQSPSTEAARRPDQAPGESSEQDGEPIDGRTNPGDAFEKILEHRADQDQQKAPGQPPEAQQRPGQADQSRSKPQADGSAQPDQREPGADAEPQQAPGAKARQDDQQQRGADQPGADTAKQEERGSEPKTPTRQETAAEDGPPSDPAQPPQGGAESSADTQAQQKQKVPDNDPAAGEDAGSGQPSERGQGAQAKGPGEPTEQESAAGAQEKPDARGGDPDDTKGPGGAGKPSMEDAASPSPQERNQQRDKRSGEADQSEPAQRESPQSPSISPKDSDSQGDTSGDRSGGGEEGGGQKSEQSGTGTAGTHTASEQGGSRSDQQGEGETGTDAGNQVEADRPTGQPASEGEGPGSGREGQPGAQRPGQEPQGQQGSDSTGGQSDSDRPSDDGAANGEGSRGAGNLSGAGEPAGERPPPTTSQQSVFRGDEANLEYANRQTDLALEYLEDQLAKEQPDQTLLDRLGWTRDDLQEFYRRWAQMKRDAAQRGPDGPAARQELDRALGSLGLRPRGTELGRGRTQADRIEGLREGFRSDPPSEWREAWNAYTRGLAEGDE